MINVKEQMEKSVLDRIWKVEHGLEEHRHWHRIRGDYKPFSNEPLIFEEKPLNYLIQKHGEEVKKNDSVTTKRHIGSRGK